MKQRIEYILIVKTIPEVSKRDGGVYTCSIGYSPPYHRSQLPQQKTNTMHHLSVNAKIAFNHPDQAEFLTTLNLARADAGLKKYGTDLSRKDLVFKDWARHALEEALDLANYCEVLINLPTTTEEHAATYYFMQEDAIRIAATLASYLKP